MYVRFASSSLGATRWGVHACKREAASFKCDWARDIMIVVLVGSDERLAGIKSPLADWNVASSDSRLLNAQLEL